jgi:DNA-binding NarL/FixJ family response regulator
MPCELPQQGGEPSVPHRRLERGTYVSFPSAWTAEPEWRDARDGARILVASTQPAFADGLCGWLDDPGGGLLVVGVCVAAEDLCGAVRLHQPVAVVATDDLASPDVVAGVHATSPEVRVLVLVSGDDPRRDAGLVRAGAGAVIPVTANRGEFVRAIQALLGGQAVVTTAALGVLAGTDGPDTPTLTHRQREVLELLATGSSTAQIAARLVVTPSTVKTHMRQIGERFGVSGQLALAVNARQLLDGGFVSRLT